MVAHLKKPRVEAIPGRMDDTGEFTSEFTTENTSSECCLADAGLIAPSAGAWHRALRALPITRAVG